MKMKFHFTGIKDSDIVVEGATAGECTQKAYDERVRQTTPLKIQGEVLE